MKLSKKLIAAFSVAAMLVTAMSVTGCKKEDDDDPEGAITGSNNNYAVNYNNTNGYAADTVADTKANTAGVYRAWNRTTFKHQGALTKVTLKKGNGNAGNKDGVMGLAWDLQTADGNDAASDTTAETFNVFGIRNYEGTLQCYVSRYFNITNKQANNFGVAATNSSTTNPTSKPTTPTEYDVSNGFQALWTAGTGEEVSVWVDVFAKLSTSTSNSNDEGLPLSKTILGTDYTSAAVGSWFVVFYSNDPTVEANQSTLQTSGNNKTFIIPAKTSSAVGSGYDSTMSSSTQRKQAVYANIYKGGWLKGAWQYQKTYHLDEVVEE